MLDVRKLKGKIIEKGFSINTLAKVSGIKKSTIYRRINSGAFTIKEADLICKSLDLSEQEAMSIFFSQYVA